MLRVGKTNGLITLMKRFTDTAKIWQPKCYFSVDVLGVKYDKFEFFLEYARWYSNRCLAVRTETSRWKWYFFQIVWLT